MKMARNLQKYQEPTTVQQILYLGWLVTGAVLMLVVMYVMFGLIYILG